MAPNFQGNLLDFSVQHSPPDLNSAPLNTTSFSAFKFKATSHNFYGSYALDLAGDWLLDLLLAGSMQPQVLPKPKKVAPNQGSWSETVSVKGAKAKTKCKTTHTDPYSGGQGSGKKAKIDVRALLAARGARYIAFLSFWSHSLISSLLSALISSLGCFTMSAPPPTSSQCCIDENTPPTRLGPSTMPTNSNLAPSLPQQSYITPQPYPPPYNVHLHLQHPKGYSPEVYMDYPCPNYFNPSQYLHPTPMPSSSVSNTSTYIASPYAIDPNYGHYLTTSPSSFPSTYSSLDRYSSFPPSQPPHDNHHHYS